MDESKPTSATAGNEKSASHGLPKKWWSEAWIWGALPFVGYYFAFSYERGFCSFFKVPSYLIEVDLNHVIAFTASLIATAYLALSLLQTIVEIATSRGWVGL